MKKPSKKILIASGVNLDLLGRRQPEIYGRETLKDMESLLVSEWREMAKIRKSQDYKLVFFQSNDESRFLSEFDKPYAGAVINAGAWTHTSLALADRLVGLGLPFVEAHISDTKTREVFRQHSFLRAHAVDVIQGLGIRSYWVALQSLISYLDSKNGQNDLSTANP